MLYDKDIREPLFDFLEEYFGKIRIIEEKNMGRSRADVVMVTEDSLVGIEIKSDADTYARLESQIRDYDHFFDYNLIVAGASHGTHVAEHVPAWWGIITVEEVDGKADFYFYRKMRANPKADHKHQLSFLWRPELAHIQEMNGMYRYKDKSKAFVIEKIYQTVPIELLKEQICEELFQRDYTVIEETIRSYKKERRRRKKYRKRAD